MKSLSVLDLAGLPRLFSLTALIATVTLALLGSANQRTTAANPVGNPDRCANGAVGDLRVDCASSAWQNGDVGHSQTHRSEVQDPPDTWIVNDDVTPAVEGCGTPDFRTEDIETAIDHPLVADGDTMIICEGTYNPPDAIEVTKSLIIEGRAAANRDDIVVQSPGGGGFVISANGTTVRHLKVVGAAGVDGICLTVTSASNIVQDLAITGCTDWAGGILISGEAADGNAVRGSTIFGNTIGVVIAGGADSNTVGGAVLADRNIIRDNAINGVFITDAGTTGNAVIGNCIGTLADCTTAAPNGFDGVAINDTTSGNTVGGVGAGNVIAFNGDDGVDIGGGAGQVVTRNVMFLNTALGINSPVTPPGLTSCTDVGGGAVSCIGTAAGPGWIVEVYRANVDASGPEGDLFFCSAVAGAGGAWGCTFPNPGGGSVTATQRDSDASGSTSGFSPTMALDGDSDGFTDEVEIYLGTDPLDACPDDPSDPAWPPDVNNDGQISIVGDVLNFRDRIGATPGAPNWLQRLDFNADGQLSVVGDVLMYRDRIGETCT